jgi:hypothetical protein
MARDTGLANGWYYRLLGEEFGPVSRPILDSLIASGQIGDSDEVREGDSGTWRPARELSATTAANGATLDSGGGTVFSLDSLGDAGLELESNDSPPSRQQEWFYQSLDHEWGPFTFDELLDHARQGHFSPDDQIRMGRAGKWRRAGSMGRVMAVFPFTAPEAKTISTEKPPIRETDDEFESRIPLREATPIESQVPSPPSPPAISAPPPPPPPPIAAPPAPPYGGMSPYLAPPVAPLWGYHQPAPTVADQGWYAWLDNIECGPMDYQQIINWVKSGRISANDFVKQGKYSQWSPASTILGLAPPQAPAPPPAPKPTPVATPSPTVPSVPVPAAAKPALQLPPPSKPASVTPAGAATPTSSSATSTAEGATKGSLGRPTLPAVPPRPAEPALPPDAPSERKGINDWGTTTVKSTYNPALATSKSATTKTLAKPAPARSKKNSSGGGVDVNELIKDKRVLGGVGIVALIALGYVGFTLLPESSARYVEGHKKLAAIYKEIEKKAGEGPSDNDWKAFGDQVKKQFTPISADLNKGKTHAAKSKLTAAVSSLKGAVGAKTPKDAESRLKSAKKSLDDAAKILKLPGG